MKIKTIVLGILTVCFSMRAMAEAPTISDVTVRQRWPWSKLVNINYVLHCDAPVDITIAGHNRNTALALPEASFSGDLYNVTSGVRRIVWDPRLTDYVDQGVLPKFKVTLTPSPIPLYMILDLTKDVVQFGQIEYVYEDALTNGLWGAWVRNPVTNAGTVVESVIWTGVNTNDIYKTNKLVLRRISAGTFGMGAEASPVSVTLTHDFYAGVFEVTQWQWNLIFGSNVSWFRNPDAYATRPVESSVFNKIRGTAEQGGGDWPTNNNVYAESFVGRIRAKTQLNGFDLPTAAQWEYACRAGTDTCFHDGDTSANVSGVNKYTNTWLSALGRYKFNGGYLEDGVTKPASDCGATNGTAIVGSYAPNAWGLYDMHGNVGELCLDWYQGNTVFGGMDPKGADVGTHRLVRGGGWLYGASSCSAVSTRGNSPHYIDSATGFRLVRTLP